MFTSLSLPEGFGQKRLDSPRAPEGAPRGPRMADRLLVQCRHDVRVHPPIPPARQDVLVLMVPEEPEQ